MNAPKPKKCRECGAPAVKVWKRKPMCDRCFTEAWRIDYLRRSTETYFRGYGGR